MAPIDFEKELHKRWRSRIIKPREQIWTRLSARLDQERPESSQGPKLWIFMAAASFVLLFGFFFFREPAEKMPSLNPSVRTQEAELPTGHTPSAEPAALSDSQGMEAESPVESHSEQIQDKPLDRNENRVARTGKLQLSEQDVTSSLAEAQKNGSPEEADYRGDLVPPAEIADTETEPGGPLEAEIDALLKNARESIALQNDPKGPSPVDAKALLDRAEDELDQTFRERIMEKLKSGVARFRTGVVDRDK